MLEQGLVPNRDKKQRSDIAKDKKAKPGKTRKPTRFFGVFAILFMTGSLIGANIQPSNAVEYTEAEIIAAAKAGKVIDELDRLKAKAAEKAAEELDRFKAEAAGKTGGEIEELKARAVERVAGELGNFKVKRVERISEKVEEIAKEFGKTAGEIEELKARAVKRIAEELDNLKTKAVKKVTKEIEKVVKEAKKAAEKAAKEAERERIWREQIPSDQHPSFLPGPNAYVEGLRLNWFWQQFRLGTGTSSFSSWCVDNGLKGFPDGKAFCEAINIRSFVPGAYEVFTNTVRNGNGVGDEHGRLAEELIVESCRLLGGGDESNSPTVRVNDRFGFLLRRAKCS